MSRSRGLVVIVVGCSAIAAAWILHGLWERERTLRQRERLVLDEVAAAHRLSTALQTRRAQSTRPHSAPTPANVAAAAGSGATSVQASRLQRNRQLELALLRTPEYAPFLQLEARKQAVSEYGDWLAQLKPARAEAVKQALAEEILASRDAIGAALAAGVQPGSREFQSIHAAQLHASDERLRRVLEPDEHASYVRYDRARPWRSTLLPELEAYLDERTLPPLTAQQKQGLAEAYVAAMGSESNEGSSAPGALYRQRNERFSELAAPSLEGRQQAAFSAYIRFVNERSQALGQLLHPEAPDSGVVSPPTGPR